MFALIPRIRVRVALSTQLLCEQRAVVVCWCVDMADSLVGAVLEAFACETM